MSSSTANDDAFIEKNAGFVLKLRLVGVGGAPQIRRVKLERLVVSGAVSFEALVGLAIQYTFPDAPLVLDDYEVALTYYDVDNDCVTIASTEELIDAVDQFSSMNPPVLRLTTDVKRKKSARSPPATPQRPRHQQRRNQQPRRGNSPGRQATQQLQTLLESFVGILATAVVALQSHMNPPAAAVPDAASDAATGGVALAASSSCQEEPERSDSNVSDQSGSDVSDTSDASGKYDEAKSFVKEVVNNINMEKEPKEDMEELDPEDKEPKEHKEELDPEERPFIHGRHTCDACLVTPIVGNRYHAINLPDYDLCSKCLGNYKGNEIQFEPVELDRDRAFQDRWHRRRARWAGGRGRCRPHRRANRKFVVHPAGMDAALEEAIRRSLQSKAEAKEEEEPKQEEEQPKVEEAPVETEVKKEEEPKKGEAETKDTSFASAAVGNGETAEVLGHTLDQCAEAIDAMMAQLSKEASSVKDAIVEELKKEVEEKQPEPTAPVEETDVSHKDAEEDVSAMTSSVPSLLSNSSEPEFVLEPTIVEAECVNAPPSDIAEVVAASGSGAVILESTTNDVEDESSQTSEDEWQVVTDDAQVAGDEMLARAFQMIGSALFESDMHSPLEELEKSSSSETTANVSSPSSVPSTVPSIVPVAVQARWANQLQQLRELGFEDEAKCVEVLERLHAANVGVDEDEEISVTRVVNEMLKND